MAKVNIFSIGKTKEVWLKLAIEEYTRRLQPILSIHWSLHKTTSQLEKALFKEKSYIALNPIGIQYTSEDFSAWFTQALETQGAHINFVIGGAEGLSATIAERALKTISLSPLTFTHQLTRLILLEQLYRATEIQKSSKYHK